MKESSCSMALCALFTALIVVGAQVSIPLPLDMRLTLQMPIVLLCGMVLGSKKAAASAAAYLISGLAGLPVFAGFSGGLGYVARPTFGFIASFIPAAFIVGLIYEKAGKKNSPVCFAAVGAGFAVIYTIGILYHFIALTFWLNTPTRLWRLFLGAGYALLILKDFVAAVLVSLIGAKINKHLNV